MRTPLANLAYTLGLALATYLGALKYFGLPCAGPGTCQAVLYSRYGSLFGVPIGFYGALLWIAILLTPDRSKRGLLLLNMAALSAVFMAIQFLGLHAFCLYCTAHALLAWIALWLHREPPRRWILPLALALAATGFLGSRHLVATRTATPPPSSSTTTTQPPPLDLSTAFTWLGDTDALSPSLVVSLDCPACLDLLAQLLQRPYTGTTRGPRLYFKTTPTNRDLTVEFTAAVLSQSAPPREAFLAAIALLLPLKDAALSAPAAAARSFATMFPAVTDDHRRRAAQLLTAQSAAIATTLLPATTPLFVPPAPATPKAFFKPEELFPP